MHFLSCWCSHSKSKWIRSLQSTTMVPKSSHYYVFQLRWTGESMQQVPKRAQAKKWGWSGWSWHFSKIILLVPAGSFSQTCFCMLYKGKSSLHIHFRNKFLFISLCPISLLKQRAIFATIFSKKLFLASPTQFGGISVVTVPFMGYCAISLLTTISKILLRCFYP